MDWLRRTLRALVHWPWLLAAVAMEGFILAALRSALADPKPELWHDLAALQAGPIALSLAQIIHSSLLRRHTTKMERERAASGHVSVVDASELTTQVHQYIGNGPAFRGTFDIFNAEMNTLEHVDFWRGLCQHKGLRQIRVILPPSIFKRFENELSANRHGLFAALNTSDKKVAVLPVHIPSELTNFAFAIARSDVPETSRSFVFIKSRPFSVPDVELKILGGQRWRYQRFLSVAPDSPLMTQCATVFDSEWERHIVDGAFHVDEMQRFGSGEGLSLQDLIAIHSLTDQEADELMRVRDRDGVLLVGRDGTGPGKHVLTFSAASGRCRAELLESEGDQARPVIVWLPPWGMGNWAEQMREVDKRLAKTFRVVHLRNYSGDEDRFSLSGAIEDGRALLKELLSNGVEYGVDPDRLVVLGVSIGAFAAAVLSAEFRQHVRGLALLAPVLDAFESIDAYPRILQGKELATRRILCAKPGFRVRDLRGGGIRLLGARAQASFILEMGLRGRRDCSFEYVGEKLREYHDAGGRLVLASSPRDEMTPRWLVDDVYEMTGLGRIKRFDLNWPHRIRDEVFEISDTADPTIGMVIREMEKAVGLASL